MTPKEKANSLIDAFAKGLHPNVSTSLEYSIAKRCAIIAVDEIIKSGPSSDTLPDVTSIHYDELKEATRYWEEVKKELLAL